MIGIEETLANTPGSRDDAAGEIAGFILQHGLKNCLELGFAHGKTTAYMAHSTAKIGGKTTAIDLESARTRTPNIYDALSLVKIDPSQVEIYFEPTSYTWRMMKFLEDGRAGTFDFVFIDGAHSWFVDGLAFCLADRLLRPGGWILFDDLNWNFNDDMPKSERAMVDRMPEDERKTDQVRKVWDLLVKTSPNYDLFDERGNWGYARKAMNPGAERVVEYQYHPLFETMIRFKNFIKVRLK
ncbi:MAG TPA: class I SAM-dependent methyltransferase [Steroidobacteraceae bacterium]|jgi:predicted O-methyltransferase YrrM